MGGALPYRRYTSDTAGVSNPIPFMKYNRDFVILIADYANRTLIVELVQNLCTVFDRIWFLTVTSPLETYNILLEMYDVEAISK